MEKLLMPEVEPSIFSLEFSVRDYEVDMQGRVNHAVYLNYCEHARHEFLKTKNMSFDQLMKQGYYFVAIKSEIEYLWPLFSQDEFIVTVEAYSNSRNVIGFRQKIYLLKNNKKIINFNILATCVNPDGKPTRFPHYDRIIT